jgi:hypothetical protein
MLCRYVVGLQTNRWFGRSWLALSAATVKIGSFMCGGMENADHSKEVRPRTERILFFQVFPNLKDAA